MTPPVFHNKNNMILEQKLSGPSILWPRGKPKDAPAPPVEPAIVELLRAHECTCIMAHDGTADEVGFNCYEIINKHGDALQLRFGASTADWRVAVLQVASHRE